MGIVRWHHHLIHECRPEQFDRAAGGVIVRVAGEEDFGRNRARERSERPARLERIPMPAMRGRNLEPDVPRAKPDGLRVAQAQVDVTRIVSPDKDAVVVIRRFLQSEFLKGRVGRVFYPPCWVFNPAPSGGLCASPP